MSQSLLLVLGIPCRITVDNSIRRWPGYPCSCRHGFPRSDCSISQSVYQIISLIFSDYTGYLNCWCINIPETFSFRLRKEEILAGSRSMKSFMRGIESTIKLTITIIRVTLPSRPHAHRCRPYSTAPSVRPVQIKIIDINAIQLRHLVRGLVHVTEIHTLVP